MSTYTLTASGLEAASLCPAKPRLEHGLPRRESEYSLTGTELHKYFRTKLDRSKLSPEHRDLMERADVLAEEFLEQFGTTYDLDWHDWDTKEHEAQLHGVISGKPDCVYTFYDEGRYVVILDFKSGFLDVEDAASNLQLSAYSALLWQRQPFRACGVCIVQPNAIGPKTTSAVYVAAQMPAVIEEIERIKAAAMDPNAQPVAGVTQCRYCEAKFHGCPAYTAQLQKVATVNVESMLALPHDQFERIGDAIKLAAMLKEDWNKEALRRIAAGEMPGWKEKFNGFTSKLTDAAKAYSLFAGKYAREYESDEDMALAFLACMEPKFGKLDELFAKLHGISPKKARRLVEDLFAGLIEKEEKAKSPVRV